MIEREQTATAGYAAFLGLVSAGLSALLSAVRAKVNAVVLGPAGIGLAAEINQLVALAFVPVNILNGPALVATTADAAGRNDEAALIAARRSALLCIGISSIVAIALSTLAGHWIIASHGQNIWQLVLLSGLGLALTALGSVATGLLTGAGQLSKLTLLALVNLCIVTVLMVGGTVLFGLTGQFVAIVIGGVVTLPISLGMARRALNLPRFRLELRIDVAFLRRALGLGTTALIGGLAMQSTLSLIRVALDRHGGAVENGQFQAAYMLGMLYFSVIAASLGNYAFPRFAAARSDEELGREISETARFIGRLAPPLLIAGIALRDVLIRTFYSNAFSPAIDALGYMTAADITKAISWTFAGPLLYRGRVRGYLVTELLAALGFGAGALLLIPHFGLMGVAYAYFGSCCLNLLVSAFTLRASFHLPMPWRALLTAYAWSAVALATQLVVQERLWARAFVLVGCTLMLYRADFLSELFGRARRLAARLFRRG